MLLAAARLSDSRIFLRGRVHQCRILLRRWLPVYVQPPARKMAGCGRRATGPTAMTATTGAWNLGSGAVCGRAGGRRLLGLGSGLYYLWHPVLWGPHVGYYGGVNYGFGYMGIGIAGGMWAGGAFRYNTAVMRVNTTVIHNTVWWTTRFVRNTTIVNDRHVAVQWRRPGGIESSLPQRGANRPSTSGT